MKIDERDVEHVARLAELAVDPAELPLLARQLQGIVDFVAQLDELTANDAAPALVVGPSRLALRPDVVAPIAMTLAPVDMAPAFEAGFYIVPRLGGMAEE